MENNGCNESDNEIKWKFQGNEELNAASISVRGMLNMLVNNLGKSDKIRPSIMHGRGDPTEFRSFRTTPIAVEAVFDALRSFEFNCNAPTVAFFKQGVYETNQIPANICLGFLIRAIAKYFSKDLSYQLSEDDVYLTADCTQSIEIIISALTRPGANILLRRPGYPQFEARAAYEKLEFRHFDLLPEKGWEVDLDSVEALADENTAAIVIINPCKPCGSMFNYQHLKKIAETARRLGILVIADEVYGHLVVGSNPFAPIGRVCIACACNYTGPYQRDGLFLLGDLVGLRRGETWKR